MNSSFKEPRNSCDAVERLTDASTSERMPVSATDAFGNITYSPNDLGLSGSLFTGITSSTQQPNVEDISYASSLIGNILSNMSLQDDGENIKKKTCSCKDRMSADFFCHDCNDHLCQKCVAAHYRVRVTKDHNIVKSVDSLDSNHHYTLPYLLSPNNHCITHTNEILNLFCDSCSTAVCSQCALHDHNGHSFQYLNQVLEYSKTVTLSLVADARNNVQSMESTILDIQRMLERVVTRSKIVETEIQSTIRKYMIALEQRERELLKKVEHVKMFRCQILSGQMDELRTCANKVKATIDEVNETFKYGNDLDILEAKDKMQASTSTSLKNVVSILAEDDTLLFVPPDLSLYSSLSSVGNIKSSICAQHTVLVKDGGLSTTATCGSVVSFTILARDHSGDTKIAGGCDSLEVTISKPDKSVFTTDLLDSGDGRFVFQLQVTLEGEYIVSAKCRGVSIRDSPCVVNVKLSVNYATRAASGLPLLIFGKEGDKAGELCRPWGICCNSQGHLIVADRSNNRIQIFNSDGSFHHMFGSSGSSPGQFDRPAGVAIDNRSRIIVADKDNHRIQIFSFEGLFVCLFGERGSKNGQFNYPWDVAVNSAGIIAVTDTRNHRIQLFGRDGTFLSKYGFEGAMWKHFDSPRGIAFTKDNRLVVTDFNNHRLVTIQPDMQSARFLGSEGTQTLQFLRPQGVALDEEGNIVVADSRNHRLQVFTPAGRLIAVFGGNLLAENVPQMDRPSGIAVTSDGHIAVVDFGNNRVLVY